MNGRGFARERRQPDTSLGRRARGRSSFRFLLSGILIAGLTSVAGGARAQEDAQELRPTVHTLTDSIVGGAGGLSIDKMGIVYAGTFDDRVYRIRMDGRPEVFATGQYGATGNVVGPMGNLFQLNFFGGYITKIDRHGREEIVARDLETPMDVTLAKGNLYVVNCGSNSISRVTSKGERTSWLTGPPFNCPNSITYASDGYLYVVNFSDPKLLRVSLDGETTEFKTMPHEANIITSARGYLYVASGKGRQLHRVSLATGELKHLAGSGERGTRDGTAIEATFNWPNGIAATGEGMVFINDLNPPVGGDGIKRPQRTASIRVISLPSLTDELSEMYVSQGADAMVAAYQKYKSDPSTAALLDEAEVDGWGKATMPVLPEAGLRVLQLNAEAYPNSWRVHDSLGDAYMSVGQPEDALASFKRSLALNPDNENAASRIKQLENNSNTQSFQSQLEVKGDVQH